MNLDTNSYIFGDTLGGDYLRYRVNDSFRIRIGGTILTVSGVGDIVGQQVLLTIQRNSSNTVEFFVNGSSVGSGTLAGSWDIAEVGGYVTNYFDGKVQSLVVYDSDQSANREDIEENIANYFGITLPT
jgi:hypothetical protein